MKISYNWLKQFIKIDWSAEKTSELLTDLGLEVEGIDVFQSIKGVNGSAVTINWLGGSAPAGTASKTEIFSFTVINTGGVFTALGSVSTFG